MLVLIKKNDSNIEIDVKEVILIDKPILIFIKTLTGRTLTFSVESDLPIEELKNRIANTHGIIILILKSNNNHF